MQLISLPKQYLIIQSTSSKSRKFMPNNNKDVIGLNREKTFPKSESQGIYKKI